MYCHEWTRSRGERGDLYMVMTGKGEEVRGVRMAGMYVHLPTCLRLNLLVMNGSGHPRPGGKRRWRRAAIKEHAWTLVQGVPVH